MPVELRHAPPLNAQPAPDGQRFVQTITLAVNGRVAGWSRWMISDEAAGVMQWMDVAVVPAQRRQGHAKALFAESVVQARQHLASRGIPLRRAWAAVSQVTHIHGRAMLTGLGFHHMAIVPTVLTGQDFLVYLKAFD